MKANPIQVSLAYFETRQDIFHGKFEFCRAFFCFFFKSNQKYLYVHILGDTFDMSDVDPFSDVEASSTQKSFVSEEFMWNEHVEMAVDSYKLNWLKARELSLIEKSQLKSWESNLPLFSKVSFVTQVYRRAPLPKSYEDRLDHSLPEIILKKGKKLRRKSNFQETADAFLKKRNFKNPKVKEFWLKKCPALKPHEKQNIVEGQEETDQVLRIFSGEPLILSEFETGTSDNEDTSDDETKSVRARQRKRQKNLPKGLPEDTTYTMDQFLQGLHPEMTSTQESYFAHDESQNLADDEATQLNIDAESSLHESRGSKKKKKKKKAIAGF